MLIKAQTRKTRKWDLSFTDRAIYAEVFLYEKRTFQIFPSFPNFPFMELGLFWFNPFLCAIAFILWSLAKFKIFAKICKNFVFPEVWSRNSQPLYSGLSRDFEFLSEIQSHAQNKFLTWIRGPCEVWMYIMLHTVEQVRLNISLQEKHFLLKYISTM
jgi:hypothetical protein